MPGLFHFLRCVGKAVIKNGVRALASLVPFGEVSFEIAKDCFADYSKENGEAELKADLEGEAQTPPDEVRQAAESFVAQEATDQPPEIRQALVSYLTQLPARIRQSLRRPSDPSGTTVPADLSLRSPEDLLPFLPAGLPRFKAGDQPLQADWELVELLGKGGFGEVWKARHLTRSRQKLVALKFCLDPIAATSLRNEVALHDQLDRIRQHGGQLGVVQLLETYLKADPPCLMYEYVEGGDLTGLILELHGQRKLTPEFAARVVHRLASTVALAHRLDPPLVHRDLKPANVLVRRGEGGKVSLLVADFGIGGLAARQALQEQASFRSVRSQTVPTAVRGAYTPLYASPQQAQGERPDPRDDVHALGVLWYQLVTGDLKLLSIPPDWRDLVEERSMNKDQVEVLASCIASRAEKRPADAGLLADRLAAAANQGESGELERMVQQIRADAAECGRLISSGQNSRGHLKRVWRKRLAWWKTQAERGLPEAQWLYGDCLLEGVGVARDLKASTEWFRKAANQGLALAQMSLGNRYWRGEGVSENRGEAVKWYRKAALQGEPTAKAILQREGLLN